MTGSAGRNGTSGGEPVGRPRADIPAGSITARAVGAAQAAGARECGWRAAVRRDILPRLVPRLRTVVADALRAAGDHSVDAWQEVRLRSGRPICLVTTSGETWPCSVGGLPALATPEELARTLALCADESLYAWEAELAEGFLTLPGGHRVGVAGRVVWSDGAVRAVRDVNGLNIRVARGVRGAARGLLPHVDAHGRIRSTLIYSPPGCGKTTVLRDLVRSLADADGTAGWRVTLIDERGEVAACRAGVPQLDVGCRCDVLDGCPKHVGMALALRAMGPEVLATDEIGRPEDAVAVLDAARSGVAVLATAHAATEEELRSRPVLRTLLEAGVFERLVRLSRDPYPGTLAEVRRAGSGQAAAVGRPPVDGNREA